MRIEIYGSFGANGSIKTVELDDNLQGVNVFGDKHSGQYRVQTISSVRVYSDHIAICVTLGEGDKNSELKTVVAIPEPKAEEPCPAEIEF